MSGHSKWHNIQAKKGKSDAARGNIFTKIGREIAIAVKQGGSDPNTNSKLRDAIAKAKSNNMPNDNINRSIKKAAGELDSVNYEEFTYEGYAAGGVAVIVECLTDNKNRTAGDVRHLFDKFGGSLGSTGCVSYMFKKRGVIDVDVNAMSEDDIMMLAIDAGADDIVTLEDVYEIYTMPGDMSKVREALENAGIEILSSEIDMIPDNINRSIKKAAGELDSVNYEEFTYEGYAAGGVAVIVECLTDNKNRTAGDVRHLFDKFGGSLGSTGCVSYMFKKRGVIDVDVNAMSEDDIMMLAIDAGADDIVTLEDVYEIYTMPGDMSKVREALENAGIEILSSEIDMIPDNEIEVDPKHKDSVIKLIDKLEELDDVQDVFHNAKDLSDEE